MSDGVKLKKGCSFMFEGQKYRGGAVRGHTIPAKVVDRVNDLNEATKKANGTKKKGDEGWLKLIDLAKITAPEEKKPVKKEDGGKP